MFPPDNVTLNVFQTGPTEVFRTPIDNDRPERIVLPPPPGIDDRAHLVRANGAPYERWTTARTATLINDVPEVMERPRVQWSPVLEEPYRASPVPRSPLPAYPSQAVVPVLNTFDERWEPSRSPIPEARYRGRNIPITVERVPMESHIRGPLQVDTSDSGDYMAPRRSEERRGRLVEVKKREETTTTSERRARSGHRPRHRRSHHELERRNRSHSPIQQTGRSASRDGLFVQDTGPRTENADLMDSKGEIFRLYQTRDPLGNVIGHFDTYENIRHYGEDMVVSPLAESEDSLVSETSYRNDKAKSDELEKRTGRPMSREELLRHLSFLNRQEDLEEERRRRSLYREPVRIPVKKAETIFGVNRPSILDLPPPRVVVSNLRRTERLGPLSTTSAASSSSSSSEAPPPIPRYGPFSLPPRGLHRTKPLQFHPKGTLAPPVVNVKSHVYDDPRKRAAQSTQQLCYFELDELALPRLIYGIHDDFNEYSNQNGFWQYNDADAHTPLRPSRAKQTGCTGDYADRSGAESYASTASTPIQKIVARESMEPEPQQAFIVNRTMSPRIERSQLPSPPPPPLPPTPPPARREEPEVTLEDTPIYTMIGTRRRVHPDAIQFKRVTRSTSLSRIPEDREITGQEIKKNPTAVGISLMPSMSCDSIPFADDPEIEYREFIVEPRIARSPKPKSSSETSPSDSHKLFITGLEEL
ncbi:unnamed protein product, partial [Mesorhabditis spiculigera]